MLRQGVSRPLLRANQLLVRRSFSLATVRMGEGDTGAPRSGGVKAEYVLCSLGWTPLTPTRDQFTRREAAQESFYIKEKEMEKYVWGSPDTWQKSVLTLAFSADRLKALKVKLKEQRRHLDELDEHMYVSPSINVVPKWLTRWCSHSDQLTREQGGEQNWRMIPLICLPWSPSRFSQP